MRQQLTAFDIEQHHIEPWCNDDWETPDAVAMAMTEIAASICADTAHILEPAAGTGQIAKYLVKVCDHVHCSEISPSRFRAGIGKVPKAYWENDDFLRKPDEVEEMESDWFKFDLAVTNPPFSLGMEFLERSLEIADKALFLLPTEYFQSQGRARQLHAMGAGIVKEWRIAGRVGYLKRGQPENNRQCYDSIFLIERTKESLVEVIDPMGRL